MQNVTTNPTPSNNLSDDNSSTATTSDSNEPAPVITSISPSFGHVGIVIELKGTSLRGFEGDENVWIQNAAGQKGIIHTDSTVNTATDIKFTLGSSYCTSDVSYSGAPCPSNLSIVPGSYSLSVNPWGTQSNSVKFTVTASTSQVINSKPSITVLSPNGGETLKIGRQTVLKWSPGNYPVGGKIISLYVTSSDRIDGLCLKQDRGQLLNCNSYHIYDGNNSGSFLWTVGVTTDPNISMLPGSYYLTVELDDAASMQDVVLLNQNGLKMNDSSDDYFTITN
jgi:hypothetical protein